MKMLAELFESDIGLENKVCENPNFRKRVGAIVFNDKNEIALMYERKNKSYLLPGGGVKENEEIHEALKREMKEELGCEVEIVKEVGMIIEHRNAIKRLQHAFCFMGKITKNGKPSMEEDEIEAGTEVQWMTIKKALKALEECKTDYYPGKFNAVRDAIFLKQALKMV